VGQAPLEKPVQYKMSSRGVKTYFQNVFCCQEESAAPRSDFSRKAFVLLPFCRESNFVFMHIYVTLVYMYDRFHGLITRGFSADYPDGRQPY
jgi:hypothetical protein